jgi:hypothetical protein
MRYVAYAGPDDYVESSRDLDDLIVLLRHLVEDGLPEDIAVWDDAKLVAVVLSDGHVVRFDEPRPCILPFRNGRAKR